MSPILGIISTTYSSSHKIHIQGRLYNLKYGSPESQMQNVTETLFIPPKILLKSLIIITLASNCQSLLWQLLWVFFQLFWFTVILEEQRIKYTTNPVFEEGKPLLTNEIRLINRCITCLLILTGSIMYCSE